MKQTPKSSIRDLVSTREAIALATFFSVAAHASAAEAPAKKEEATKNKKKGEDNATLDEITVDAARQSVYNPQQVQSPKFTAPLLNTPQSVTVVPKEVYTQQAAISLNDVLKNTPGITFLGGEGGNPTNGDNQFRMRGFDAGNSIFVDGVRDSGQQDRDIFNIEQVEIARGPAGADVGRSTAAGYINLATKAPLLEQFVRGTTSYAFDETDSDGSFRQTVDYNLPLSQLPLQGAALRVNALYQEGGVIGRNLAESNRWAIAPSFAIGLNTDTRFIFQFDYMEQDNLPDFGMPRAALESSVGGDNYTPGAPSVAHNTSYSSKHAYEDVTSISLGARIEHDIRPDLLFTNQTRFNQNNRQILAVAPTAYTPAVGGGTVTRNFTGNDRVNENFSNISTLRADLKTGAIDHVLSAGLELIHETNDTVGFGNGTASPVDITNPDHGAPVVLPTRTGALTESALDTVSLSLNETAILNEQWQITGGLRAEYYDLDYRSRATDVAGGAVTKVKTDDFLLNSKIGVIYKPRTNGSVYVSYNRSEQNPGTNLNMSASGTGTGADNVNLDPQESINYELGTKWNFLNDKLSTSLAVFHAEQKNIGVADAITGEIVQTAEQTVTGVEATVAGQITDNWAVFGGILYADSENKNPEVAAADNAEIQWTPDWSGNLWTTYRFDFGLTIGGGMRYSAETSRSTTTATIGNLTGTDAYWVFDALASYEVTENVTVRLNVNNIFDENYLRSVNNNGGRFNYGAPRSYVISADWKF